MTVSLLCLPCAGASASMYLRWQRSLPGWLRLVPVELPGRGVRSSEDFIGQFDTLIEHLCQMYERHCSGRYALYGHSMGGLVAYEMARHWRSQSRRLPEALFTSASPAPKHREPGHFLDKQTDAALVAELRKQGGTPEEVFDSPEMLRMTLDTLCADYRVCSGYRYRKAPPLPLPIHVFAGREDDIDAQRMLAWEAETSERFSLRWYDGGHFFIRRHERELLGELARHLDDGAAAPSMKVTRVG